MREEKITVPALPSLLLELSLSFKSLYLVTTSEPCSVRV